VTTSTKIQDRSVRRRTVVIAGVDLIATCEDDRLHMRNVCLNCYEKMIIVYVNNATGVPTNAKTRCIPCLGFC
jgi:hypothetical protein